MWNINDLTEEQVRLCAAALKPQPELPTVPTLTYKVVSATDTTEYRLGDWVVSLTSSTAYSYSNPCISWIKAARARFGLSLKAAKDIWDQRMPA